MYLSSDTFIWSHLITQYVPHGTCLCNLDQCHQVPFLSHINHLESLRNIIISLTTCNYVSTKKFIHNPSIHRLYTIKSSTGPSILIHCFVRSECRLWVAYLHSVYPFPDVDEGTLVRDVIQQQHSIRAPEVRLGNTAESARKRELRLCQNNFPYP